jgi:trehalose utilization protein
VRVLCWSERTEREEVYPEGINGAVAQALQEAGGFETRVSNLADADQGVSEDLLAWADVLVWFSHLKHRDVTDGHVTRIVQHVQERGLGYIPLHSSLDAELFKRVLGHRSGSAGWREDGCPSVVNVCQRDHPIAQGLDRMFVIPMEEMYGEPFAIKPPDELVFISSFAQGEVIRSGCCWYVGKGRVFYFQPGHETYPVYYQKEVKLIMANACRWAAGRTNSEGGVGGSWWKSGEVPPPRSSGPSTGRLGEQVPELSEAELRLLADHLRWAGRTLRGNMDAYRAVRFAALNDACSRAAAEVERAAREGNQGLLALAARLREQCLAGDVPDDVPLPPWRADRPMPELDHERVRREQQMGFGLGLAQCAARIHIAAGGQV